METLNSIKFELLNGDNYAIWSIRMEAILDSKDLFEDVILKGEPVKLEGDAISYTAHNSWIKKNKEAYSLIVLSLTAEQAMVYKGIKKAKEIWDALKTRYEGAAEDRKIELMLEMTRLKKQPNETLEGYLTRAQGIARQITEQGKQITERELVRYIVEGLPHRYEDIINILSANRNINFIDLRQTLLNFEKKIQEKNGNDFKAYRTFPKNRYFENKPNQKLCHICKKSGHLQKDCWYANKNKPFSKENNTPHKKINNKFCMKKEQAHVVRQNNKCETIGETALTTSEFNLENEETWHLDSACTSHMTSNENWIENKKKENNFINVAEENRSIESTYRGEIAATSTTDEEAKSVRLTNVLCVPKLRGNLMSVPNIVKNGCEVVMNNTGAYIYDVNRKLVCKGEFTENMFIVKLKIAKSNTISDETCFKIKENSYELWHKRLGHINYEYLKMMLNKNMVRGLEKIEGNIEICDSCVRGKMPRNPPLKVYSQTTTNPLELLHVDLCGPFRVKTLGEKGYMMVVVDDFSRRYFVELLKSKDEAKYKLQRLITQRENELNIKVKRIRSDNGLEFINEELQEYCSRQGIKHEKAIPYSPRSNGVAERANRTLLDKTRTLLIDSELPLSFWGEAIATAEYLHNIMPTKNRDDKTPMELWSSKKPSVKHLKPFGCLAYYKVDKNKRHKLEPKAKRGIFVGYSRERRAYRIYDQEEVKLHETSDVIFNEEKKGYKLEEKCSIDTNYFELEYTIQQQNEGENCTLEPNIDEQMRSDTPNSAESDTLNSAEVEADENESNELDNEDETIVPHHEINRNNSDNIMTRPTRNRKVPQKYNDYEVYITEENTPKTFEDVMACKDKKLWIVAMNEEMNSMNLHDVWKTVKRPQNKKVIKSRWVYKIKETPEEKKYKARLVAIGCGQKPGIDYEESFSPVMKWDTLRVLLTLAASKNSVIKLFDVKTAYLNSELEEEVYMEPPPGYTEDNNLVFKIKRSIYGLPQSGRCWYKKFTKILEVAGFKNLKSDPCVYTLKEGEHYIHLGIYVDDFIVISDSEEFINKVLNIVKQEIEVKETTNSNMFLGVKIEQRNHEIILSQKEYINKILKKFEMEDCNPVKTPGITGDSHLDNYETSKSVSQEKYQEAIGSIMYLAIGTRPDIAYNVSKLSQYSKDPREIHWLAVKRLIRYLKGTEDYRLMLKPGPGQLNANTDASWSTTHDARSFSGYFIKMGNALVSWKSGKQKLVALSTMEAELIAACDGVCHLKWLKFLLQELCYENLVTAPITIETDSKAMIDWINNPRISPRTRHINRKFYFVKDEVEKDEIRLEYKCSEDIESDIMTKNLSAETWNRHVFNLGLGF